MLQSSAADRSQAVDLLIPSNQTASSNAGSRDLHAVTKARYQKEMREELLSKGAFSYSLSLFYVFTALIAWVNELCYLLVLNTWNNVM